MISRCPRWDFYQLSSRSNLQPAEGSVSTWILVESSPPANQPSSKPFCRFWPRKCKLRKPKMRKYQFLLWCVFKFILSYMYFRGKRNAIQFCLVLSSVSKKCEEAPEAVAGQEILQVVLLLLFLLPFDAQICRKLGLRRKSSLLLLNVWDWEGATCGKITE